jgi:uncharacterized membrane protein
MHVHATHHALGKTLSFAVVHFGVALLVGRLLTGSWLIASTLALIEPACNTVAYFFHERFWLRLEQRRRRRQSSRHAQHTGNLRRLGSISAAT